MKQATTSKYNLLPSQRRDIATRLSDQNAAKDFYVERSEWYAEVTKLQQMALGNIEYEPPVPYHLVDIEEKANDAISTGYFIVPAPLFRPAKILLFLVFGLATLPQGAVIPNGYRRLSVRSATEESCRQVFEANRHLFTSFSMETNKVTAASAVPSALMPKIKEFEEQFEKIKEKYTIKDEEPQEAVITEIEEYEQDEEPIEIQEFDEIEASEEEMLQNIIDEEIEEESIVEQEEAPISVEDLLD